MDTESLKLRDLLLVLLLCERDLNGCCQSTFSFYRTVPKERITSEIFMNCSYVKRLPFV
jgi:hypothetical protein